MLMKKLSKIICLSLSMMLLIETAGMNVRAADVYNDTTQEVSDTVETEKEPVVDVPEEKPDVPTDDSSKEDKNVADDVTDDSSDTAVIDDSALVEEDGESEEQVPEDEAVVEEQLETQDTEETNNITKEVVSTSKGFRVTYSEANEGDYCKVYLKNTESNSYGTEPLVTATFDSKYEASIDAKDLSENANAEYRIVYEKKPDEVPVDNLEAFDVVTPTPVTIVEDLLYTPITNLVATPGHGSVELTWDAFAENITYSVSYEGLETPVSTEETSYTFEDLIKGKEYTFTVRVDLSSDSEEVKKFAEASVTATTLFNPPAAVTGFKGTPGASQAILTWNEIAGCSGYELQKYVSGRWVYLTHQTRRKVSYTDKVAEGQTYTYRIRTYLNAQQGGGGTIDYNGQGVAYSNWSQISVYVPKYENVIPMRFDGKIKSKAPFFATASSKKKLGYLKKGTPYKALDVSGDRFYCQLKDGRKVWVAKKRMNFTKQYWTKKDYTKETKERFVNSRNISSKTKYMLWTSFYTQKANVFTGYKGNWKLIRVCPVSTGDAKHNSAMGMKTLYKKSKGWFRKSYYVKPVYYFSGANAFHSRLHKYKGGYKDGGVGRPLTNGCIRMNDPDIQWIYKNCPLKTRVYNY